PPARRRAPPTAWEPGRLVDQVADPLPPHPPVLTVPGPVDDEGLAADVVQGHEAPEATVVAPVAVVPHHEDLVRRNGHGSEVVARRETALGPGALDEMAVGIVHLFAVDVDLLVLDLDRVAGLADHALDEVLARIDRVDEHDDVAATGILELD